MANFPGPEKNIKEGLVPLKELAGPKGVGFKNLPELKEILGNLKELTKTVGFYELSAFKDILKPIKELDLFDPITGNSPKEGKGSKGDKDNNHNNDAKAESKDDKHH